MVINTTLPAVMLLLLLVSGCQSRPSGTASSSSRPTSREPLHRVEVTSATSADLADSLIGRKCRVQLRRDALGMASTSTAALSGRWADQASVDGEVVEVTDQWIVVQSGKRTVIPHASILLIELQD